MEIPTGIATAEKHARNVLSFW